MSHQSNPCLDGLYETFTQEVDFLDYIEEREKETTWYPGIPTKSLEFHAIPESEQGQEKARSDCKVTEDVLLDSLHPVGSGLTVKAGGETYLLRNTAMKSVLDRMAISGNALNRLSKEKLALVLNECAAVCKGKSLINKSDEKVSAILGDDHGEYVVLPMKYIFDNATATIHTSFPKAQFVKGYYCHDIAVCVYSLAEYAVDFTKAYGGIIADRKCLPALRLSTSNTGFSSFLVEPLLIPRDGFCIPLNSSLKVKHKGHTTMEMVDDALNAVYASITEGVKKLSALGEIQISNPHDTLARVMKFVGIQKKVGAEILATFDVMYYDTAVTALDLYLAICEAAFIAENSLREKTASALAKINDSAARCLGIRWENYDFDGKCGWYE